MENINENPVAEEAVVEAPVVENTPVVEAPAEPVKEEAPVEEPKAEEPKPADVITTPAYAGSEEVPALGAVANGAIGATSAPRAPRKAAAPKPEKSKDTVAIRSTKNVTWTGVGKVSKGINIVSKEDSVQWLTRDHITLVEPEQVAKEFGN